MVRRTAGSAALVLAGEAIPLHVEPALFEAMIEGWRRQHSARRLSPSITRARERTVRRFADYVEGWPWQWRSEQLDAWVAQGHWAHSTIRGYQGSVALFLDYVCDPRYGWVEACMERVGEVPSQICHEWNTATHVVEHEGRPERRPLTRDECQLLFDVADEAVTEIAGTARKGFLAAFRDATLFKVIYGWGLRRREAAMLDVGDFSVNPAAPELGGLGVCQVRYGKAMKGSPPRRRSVASVMPWAVEALEQYLGDVRPRYGVAALGPALWLSERGERISARRIDERFAAWRRRAGLSVHCLRHSYVSHLIEDGVDPLFVQHQVGHSWASTTAVYTSVGSDHKNRMLRAALDRAFRADIVNNNFEERESYEDKGFLPVASPNVDGGAGDVRHV
jgi:integrase/recombinase XerC